MTPARRAIWVVFLVALVAVSGTAYVARAADEPAAQPTSAAAPKVDSGDNAWMLTSSALVLMMTGPGLALFYSGLVRKKNVLSVMMQCIFLMCLMTVIWALYGFTISFGGDRAGWGDARYLFMNGVRAGIERWQVYVGYLAADQCACGDHMLFQGMFFIITPALICGAFAERMKFSTMVVFMILWGTFIYCPLAHWVWGGGFLQYGSEHAKGIFCWRRARFRRRHGRSHQFRRFGLDLRLVAGQAPWLRQNEPMPPHNLTYTAIGAAMLWVGWFGFNAGSAVNAGGLASQRVLRHALLPPRRPV